jgi:DNA-binding winged helix-turn-helix (wHTH) protein/tetratricopeptide (TPR) repeat protein
MIYRFGPFELDEGAGELRRGGESVAIQPKPLALLALLIRERSRVVTHEELFGALWPDTIVTPSSLTRAVSHARRAIRDTHKGDLLRSIPRRGYRFTAEVVELGARGAAGEAVVAARASGIASAVVAPATAPSEVFVGRQDVLARLREAWLHAREGSGRLVLVGGAAGMGKTRLAEVFGREMSEQGARVVFGRGRDGEGVPAFWLWSQVLRALSASELVDETSDWEALLSKAGDASDPQQRFRFFDSVARALFEASRTRRLIVVLEDLQWATPPSLRLLEHLSFELADSRLLVIGTIRSETRARGHPLSRSLSILARHECCEQLELRGLSRGDIGALLREVIGRPAPAELTSELFARTEGVPLFVREAVRLLGERGDLKRPERIRRRGITLPDHAVDLIRRSLDTLSEDCAAVVAAGSVLGRDVTVPAVAAVAGFERPRTLDLLDEAVSAGVIEAMPDSPAGYRFTHALFRDAAYEALQPGQRARLHARAAARLETRYAEVPGAVAAELAHHHHRSIGVGDPERAFECAIAAAEEASRVFAYEQAATHYGQAVDALEHLETLDPERRLATLIELGEAHRRAGDRERRRAVSMQAMEGARALGRRQDFARAVIRFCDLNEWSPEDPEADAVVEEALDRVGEDEVALRARLLARKAYLGIRHESSKEIALRAAALGRTTGDPATLQEVLYVLHYALAGPDRLRERRELAEELLTAARSSRSRDSAVIALLDVACDDLSVGDREDARRMRAQAEELAGDAPTPSIRWHTRVYDTGLLILEGRTSPVEQMMADALLVGRRITHPYAQGCFNGHRMQLCRYRGEYAAIRPLFARAPSSSVGANHWGQAVLARNEIRLGDRQRAHELWESLAARDFQDIARGIRWIGTIVELAHLCADMEDASRAEILIELLAPVEDLHGVLPIPILYGGPASYCLARLHELLGLADDAAEYYEHALEGVERLAARPMQARIQRDLARLLERRGDRERAAELGRQAEALVQETGCRL